MAASVALTALPFMSIVPRALLFVPFFIGVAGLILCHPAVSKRLPFRNIKAFSTRQIGFALLILFSCWLLAGLTLYTLAKALSLNNIPFFLSAGIYAAAWLAGFLSFWAPAGIGVREAILVFLLTEWLPETDAILVSVSLRLILLMSEVILFLFFLIHRQIHEK